MLYYMLGGWVYFWFRYVHLGILHICIYIFTVPTHIYTYEDEHECREDMRSRCVSNRSQSSERTNDRGHGFFVCVLPAILGAQWDWVLDSFQTSLNLGVYFVRPLKPYRQPKHIMCPEHRRRRALRCSAVVKTVERPFLFHDTCWACWVHWKEQAKNKIPQRIRRIHRSNAHKHKNYCIIYVYVTLCSRT